ncbi:uncharacterized protein [Elaeis guineensis]|uniref:uncharacterized protein n=1 Tax=Elaeis guineensis var. tenera TaxID=51953 RepID=UPI003C6D14D6
MPGIDSKVISHHLRMDPIYCLVKQKKQNFISECQKAIAEKVDRLLKVSFIRKVMYPDWLANIVLVKKANRKWCMCIDFIDLNKICSKDSYPLSRIDQLVDATSGHELLKFMNTLIDYNQIRMAPKDEEKIIFIIDHGLYCYRMMSFDLKNVGATYQRLVDKILKYQLDRNMEAYVDDKLVKSRVALNHIADLRETFDTLCRFWMKLNLVKYAFGVTVGKFFWFMISRRGIKANLEKIKVVLEMAPSRTIGEVQRLTDKIASLNRFVSRSIERENSKVAESSKKGENPGFGESLRDEEVDIGFDPKELETLHVDGLLTAMRVGARLILTNLEGEVVGYTLRFDFSTTNNDAEYESLLSSLRVAREAGAQHLKVFSNSQLVVGYIKGGYKVREENMKTYLQKVSRIGNAKVDVLSKLTTLLHIDWEERTYFESFDTPECSEFGPSEESAQTEGCDDPWALAGTVRWKVPNERKTDLRSWLSPFFSSSFASARRSIPERNSLTNLASLKAEASSLKVVDAAPDALATSAVASPEERQQWEILVEPVNLDEQTSSELSPPNLDPPEPLGCP